MTFKITSSIIGLVLISVIAIGFTTYLVSVGNDYGVTVPDQYQGAFNNFDALEANYSNAQESIREGDVDQSANDIAIFTNVITAVRQLGNIIEFGNAVLADISRFLGIPDFFISGFFVILSILTTAAIIAFIANRGNNI